MIPPFCCRNHNWSCRRDNCNTVYCGYGSIRNWLDTFETSVSGSKKCFPCWKEICPGNNISNCPEICTVPCKKCKQYSGCQSVDHGRSCTAGSGDVNA